MALISEVLSDAVLDQLNQASMEWPTGPSTPQGKPQKITTQLPEPSLPEMPLASANLPKEQSLPVPITSAPPAPPRKPPTTAIMAGYPDPPPLREIPAPPTGKELSTNLRGIPPSREVDVGESARTAFRRDLAGVERRYGTQTYESLRQMNSLYNLGVDLSNARNASLMERLSGRMHKLTGGRLGSEVNTMSYLDAYTQIQQGYARKLDDYIKSGQKAGTIGADASAVADAAENDIMRRRYMNQAKLESAVKPTSGALEKGGKSLLKGAGGKAAAVVGLLTLGGVIGNMFSGGHRSNAELYNPNGYSQYYS